MPFILVWQWKTVWQVCFKLRDFPLNLDPSRRECRRDNFHFRFIGIIEQSEKGVIIAVSDRVIFMSVTLGTTKGQSQPCRGGRAHAIGHRVEAELQRIDSPFFVKHRISMKPRRDTLIDGRAGKHVTSQLLDRKLIVRHIGVDRVDDPVAVRPDRSLSIFFIAIRIRIASQIEPFATPAFSVMRRSQQSVEQLFVGIRRCITDEVVGLFGCRR